MWFDFFAFVDCKGCYQRLGSFVDLRTKTWDLENTDLLPAFCPHDSGNWRSVRMKGTSNHESPSAASIESSVFLAFAHYYTCKLT